MFKKKVLVVGNWVLVCLTFHSLPCMLMLEVEGDVVRWSSKGDLFIVLCDRELRLHKTVTCSDFPLTTILMQYAGHEAPHHHFLQVPLLRRALLPAGRRGRRIDVRCLRRWPRSDLFHPCHSHFCDSSRSAAMRSGIDRSYWTVLSGLRIFSFVLMGSLC